MPLDPEVKKYLAEFYRNNIFDMSKYTIQEVRRLYEEQTRKYPKVPIHRVQDMRISSFDGYELPIRVYYPDDERGHGIILHFHGGGWVIGSIETEDNISRMLANYCNCVVVSVDYRLAPEHKFPTAVYDCFASLQWVKQNAGKINGDSGKVALFGISAGGNLVTATSLLAKQRGVDVRAQVAVTPLIGLDVTSRSMHEYRQGYGLDMSLPIDFMIRSYAKDINDTLNPLFNPLMAEDLSGLPESIIVTAEYDPLRDQAEAYAYRLMEAGVPTLSIRVNGMIHSFSGSPRVTREVIIMVSSLLRSILSGT